jgi:hypothetical protein
VETISSSGTTAIEVYPNPAQGLINVNLTGFRNVDGVLTIVDALGKTVFSKQCTETVSQLELSRLADGIYTILFNDENGRVRARLIITR